MHACCTGILFRCVPEFLTVHLDTVPVHSGMIRSQEDRLARQIKQWQPDTPTSQLYQITPQRARFIPRNFHTRGRERASGSLPADSENNKSLVLPIRRGSGARRQRRQHNAAARSGEQRFGNRHHHGRQEHHLLGACLASIDRRHPPRTFPRIRSLPPLFNRSLSAHAS